MLAALLRGPVPDTLDIEQDGHRVRVRIRRRPNARRLTLRVSNASGEVVLTLPARTSLKLAQDFATRHLPWIAARLAKLPARSPFAAGVSLPLRGRPHRLVCRPGRGVTAACVEGDEPIILACCEPAHLERRVRDFLAREARRDLAAAVATYCARLEVRASGLTLRDTRSRWGSCTARGGLNFSWRLILAPPMVLDYLAAHEVAHLREMNHSPRFWAGLRAVCAHVDEAEAWLRKHGSALHRYG